MAQIEVVSQTFTGGLSLAGHNDVSTRTPIRRAPVPKELVLPLQQHVGAAAEPIVSVGERVYRGQMIARPPDFLSAAVHASSSGIVTAIAERPVPHPSGRSGRCIVIETDGQDEALPMPPMAAYRRMHPSALRNRIRQAGVVGLGGAAFPTAVKLTLLPGRSIDTLIINGAECEPYLTCDDMLMRERAAEIIRGMEIMRHLLGARECLIGVEQDMPAALAAMREAMESEAGPGTRLVAVPTRYPAGGELQLIETLLGREVPANGMPSDIGVICQNVATAAAVYRAVFLGEALTSRVVTVSGDGIAEPANVEVRLGTPIAELAAFCGGYKTPVARLLMGGPMMGFALPDDQVPIIKASNCILCASAKELPAAGREMPCIRCGACVDACPARLLPQELYWQARSRNLDGLQDYNLFDCIECGCCAAVCPSQIPLVQYYRAAKSEIGEREREREQAHLARMRHEQRQARRQRHQAAAEARLREKEHEAAEGDPQAAIEAALARARAKRIGKTADEDD